MGCSVIESCKLYDNFENEKKKRICWVMMPDERHMVLGVTRESTYLEHLLDSGLIGALLLQYGYG